MREQRGRTPYARLGEQQDLYRKVGCGVKENAGRVEGAGQLGFVGGGTGVPG